jgi:hypothetical protein
VSETSRKARIGLEFSILIIALKGLVITKEQSKVRLSARKQRALRMSGFLTPTGQQDRYSTTVLIQSKPSNVLACREKCIQSKPSNVLACRDSDRLYLLAQSKDPGCTSHSTARLIILS